MTKTNPVTLVWLSVNPLQFQLYSWSIDHVKWLEQRDIIWFSLADKVSDDIPDKNLRVFAGKIYLNFVYIVLRHDRYKSEIQNKVR